MLWRITLLTNPDVCNLRCGLCFLRQRGKPFGKGEMPWEIAERAVRRYAQKGVREVIPSTMGEPLLYSQFEKLERLVGELGLKLNVTTNGTFPRKGADAWARELLPVSKDVKISCWGISNRSLDVLCPGLDPRIYLENVKSVLRVRRELLDVGKPAATVSLQMAVCRTNLREVEDVVGWAAAAGVDRVKLNRAVFLSRSTGLQKSEGLLPGESWKGTSDVPFKLEGSFLQPSASRDLGECPFLGRELWILPDGSAEPCPDPENRFWGTPPGKGRCEICRLFPRNPLRIG